MSSRLGPRRLVTAGATSFAIVAILLAVFGLYGMLSQGVLNRTREIVVRLALLVLVGALVLAGYRPVRAAVRIDPAVSLRTE